MEDNIYIRLDVDNAGDKIELSLLKSNYKKAQDFHDHIQNNINFILEKIKFNHSTTILMKGCDDILFSIEKKNYDLNFLRKLKDEFKSKSGFSLSMGVGFSVNEAMLNLRIAKISGKDKIVETAINIDKL